MRSRRTPHAAPAARLALTLVAAVLAATALARGHGRRELFDRSPGSDLAGRHHAVAVLLGVCVG